MMYFKHKFKSQRKLKSAIINYKMDKLTNEFTRTEYKESIKNKLAE